MPDDLSFQVSWSHKAIAALKEAGSKARQSAKGKQLAKLVREIDGRLRREPGAVGEVYRIRGAVEEYLAVVDVIAIDFAIDQQRRLVLVRKCRTFLEGGFQ
jgi:hypothetical protein